MSRRKRKKYKQIRHQRYVTRKVYKTRRRRHRGRSSSHRKVHYSAQSKANKHKHYSHLVQILEYNVLFGSEHKPTFNELLAYIPREMAIKIAGTINNLYGNAELEKLNRFFATSSLNNRQIVKGLLNKYFKKNPHSVQIFWATAETPIQLLRYAFAFPFNKIKADEISNEEAELFLFKLILLMNEKATDYHINEKDMIIENMLFLLSVLNNNMHGQDEYFRKDRSIMQLYMAVEFFQYLESVTKYHLIYEAFLRKHGVKSWNEYIRSIFGLISMLNYKAGWIPADLRNDSDSLISFGILESISRSYSDNIQFYSAGPMDRSGNTDYKAFRERPLIKMPNGDYYLFSWEFMVDRLYNSLYFEFKELPISENMQKRVPSLFTDNFSEKVMFDRLLENSISPQMYKLMSEEFLRKNYKHKSGELGPPDFLLESMNSYIIFECKDVRIGGDETEKHDFDTLIDIYSNKLYKKRWRYEDGIKTYFSEDKDGRIGITQLTGHLSDIRQDKFKYHNTKSDKKIYPVLILSDYKYVHRGFTRIANKWYQESLVNLGESNTPNTNRPLIVMSFITLIKYKNLFCKYGFEHYFELFYKLYSLPPISREVAIESNMSFDDFMARYPFDLSTFHKKLMIIITADMKKAP